MAPKEDFVEDMYEDFVEFYWSKGLMKLPHCIPAAPDDACNRCLEVKELVGEMPWCQHKLLCKECDDEKIERLRTFAADGNTVEDVKDKINANFCMQCRAISLHNAVMWHEKRWKDEDDRKYKLYLQARLRGEEVTMPPPPDKPYFEDEHLIRALPGGLSETVVLPHPGAEPPPRKPIRRSDGFEY
jgi:hypothetical protein